MSKVLIGALFPKFMSSYKDVDELFLKNMHAMIPLTISSMYVMSRCVHHY